MRNGFLWNYHGLHVASVCGAPILELALDLRELLRTDPLGAVGLGERSLRELRAGPTPVELLVPACRHVVRGDRVTGVGPVELRRTIRHGRPKRRDRIGVVCGHRDAHRLHSREVPNFENFNLI